MQLDLQERTKEKEALDVCLYTQFMMHLNGIIYCRFSATLFFIQQARIHQLEKQLECTSVELSRVQVQCITMLVWTYILYVCRIECDNTLFR